MWQRGNKGNIGVMAYGILYTKGAKPTTRYSQEHSSGRAEGTGTITTNAPSSTVSAGTYNIIATDANNCHASTTIVITQPSAFTLQSTNYINKSCNATNDAEVSITNGGGTVPYNYTLMPSGAINNNGVFNGLAAGNYTITCTDAHNCATFTATYIVGAPTANMCCIPSGATTNTVVTIPNIILLNSPMASNLSATYGNVITGKTFYIDGVFTINANITFDNCTLYFTTNSIVYNNTGFTLNLINYTTLEAACDTWQGIQTQNSTSKVAINSNSTIKKATYGIHAINNAIVEATQANFTDCITAGIYFSGITASPYLGYVEQCNFTNPTALPAPYLQTEKGIWVEDCTNLQIGNINNALSGNTFNGLQMGIHVKNKNIANSQIGLYNNVFESITDNTITGSYIEATKVNNCYTNKHGAAIWAKTGTIGNPQTTLDVRNTNTANVGLMMEDCDKGIVASNTRLTAKNLFMQNTLMGVMCNNTTGKSFDIQDNSIDNAFIGMQFGGDNGNSISKNNSININVTGIADGLYSQIWPIAIDVKNFTNLNNGIFDINKNTISINGYSGIGINMNNTSNQVLAYKNTINLTNTDGTIVCMNTSNLNGIAVNNALGTQLEANEIIGNTTLLAQQREDQTSILVNNCNGQRLHCNLMDNTRFGITGISECLTTNDAVKGNIMNGQIHGMLFRYLGTDGTFGDIGTVNNDNNNQFTGANFVKKVFKFCEDPQGYAIYTDPLTLDPIESGSVDINNPSIVNLCKYGVAGFTGPHSTYACPIFPIIGGGGNTGGNLDDIYYSLDEAIQIATDIKIYVEYIEISKWIDRRRLFMQLSADENFRNSNVDLLSFYTNMLETQYEQLRNSDENLNLYIQALIDNNSTAITTHRQTAESSNDSITNLALQNTNEKLINSIYFKFLRFGIDSLNDTNIEQIETMANQCPYTNGTAV
jgi:hypothetical protein